MEQLPTKIELLAPAKDLECGIIAIDCGADAVYIGAPKFGARESAGNTIADIAELALYAHKYWAKVYVTVNTLLFDDEIPLALDIIKKLYEIGIDGLIIQDVGLLECDLPPIPIIASTQMHNNTPGKVAFLESVGIKRVILARELSLEEIQNIRSQTNIELECFIHGSLCVCNSGQCYMSYAIGGRSGNKGQCAQPCRKLYNLLDEAGNVLINRKHLLSLKDLNLSDYLEDMIKAGVCSFKIEGRLKDKTYVANVVSDYRIKLDNVIDKLAIQKTSSGKSIIEFVPNLHKTFNRGFSSYFILGKGDDIASVETPKMMGELLGKVKSIQRYGFEIDCDVEINKGDGICFFNKMGELSGSLINDVNGKFVLPDKKCNVERGSLIYRNSDIKFLTALSKNRTARLIDVKISLRETEDGFLLKVIDEDNNSAELAYVCEKVLAQKPEQALDNMKRQLQKLGGTEFDCNGIDINLKNSYFIPISAINDLRRGVLDKLREVRLANRPVNKAEIIKNDTPYPIKNLLYTGNVTNNIAENFYRRHGVESIKPGAETGIDLHGEKVMTTKYCIRNQFDKCLKESKLNKHLYMQDEENHKFKLKFNCTKCEMEVWLD